MVLWTVDDGMVAFGQAAPHDGRVEIRFDDDPPEAAIPRSGVAIGTTALVLHPVADGTKLSSQADLDALGINGIDTLTTMLWRTPDAMLNQEWIGEFDSGYTCGQCSSPVFADHDILIIGDAACELSIDRGAGLDDACNLP